MILLVVFVPAFSMIFSPAYLTKSSECPPCECPTCPECPPPPQLYFLRIYPWYTRTTIEENSVSATLAFGVSLRKIVGYKYFILVNLHLYDISWAEYCFGVDEEGSPLCNYVDFGALNSTHSYAFISDNIRDFLIEIYAWGERIDVNSVHVIILVVPEHYTLQDVLRDLQRVTIP